MEGLANAMILIVAGHGGDVGGSIKEWRQEGSSTMSVVFTQTLHSPGYVYLNTAGSLALQLIKEYT